MVKHGHTCTSSHPAKQTNTQTTKASLRAAPTLNMSSLMDCSTTERTSIMTISLPPWTNREDPTDNNPPITGSPLASEPIEFVFNISLLIIE